MDAQLSDLNDEISEVRAAITRRKKMKSRLKHLNHESVSLKRQARYLADALRKEERDVNKLLGLSVRAMFQETLGNLSFYDNLITDWIVQKSTSNQINPVKAIADKVSRIMATLKADHRKLVLELRSLNRLRKKIIVTC